MKLYRVVYQCRNAIRVWDGMDSEFSRWEVVDREQRIAIGSRFVPGAEAMIRAYIDAANQHDPEYRFKFIEELPDISTILTLEHP